MFALKTLPKRLGHESEPCRGSTMAPEATRKRIAALQREIDFIHYANELYWRQASPSDAARADYFRRQDRLEEIRSELAKLQDPT